MNSVAMILLWDGVAGRVRLHASHSKYCAGQCTGLSGKLKLYQLKLALMFEAFDLTDHVCMIRMIEYAPW